VALKNNFFFFGYPNAGEHNAVIYTLPIGQSAVSWQVSNPHRADRAGGSEGRVINCRAEKVSSNSSTKASPKGQFESGEKAIRSIEKRLKKLLESLNNAMVRL
jgi:hypothetical protein